MTRAWPALIAAMFATGCGASTTPATTAPSHERATTTARPTAAAGPRSATELATLLRGIVAGTSAGAVEEHIDAAFSARLPSTGPLDALFRGWPADCVPTLSESPGYSALAIPPPMNDTSPEETRRIEGLIEELRATTEVEAQCTVINTYQDEADEPATAHEETLMLFAIAARADANGVFHALAWRDFRPVRAGITAP